MKRLTKSFLAMLTSLAAALLLSVILVTPASAADGIAYVPTTDFTAYCQAHGYETAKLVAQNAYGWRCVTGDQEDTFSVTAVCREQTVKDNEPTVLDFLNDFNDVGDYGWWCYRLSQVEPLGQLDVNRYCQSQGYDRAILQGGNTALSWVCYSPSLSVALNTVGYLSVACGLQYPSNLGNAAARVVNYYDPSAIDCMV